MVRSVGILAAAGAGLWAQTSSGFHPRPLPADYAASQQTQTVTYAASIVPADEVKHIFAVDISKTYVVFEVALYPAQPGSFKIDSDNFTVKSGPKSEFVHSADPVTVASVMQEKNMPRRTSGGTTDVYTHAGVGYESGTDPYTGRRVHGTYTEAGVGVANGPDAPPYPLPPGSSPQDRATLENQLEDKALPNGDLHAPVAGFLYFPAKSLKKDSKGNYELEYLGEGSGRVDLAVSAKAR